MAGTARRSPTNDGGPGIYREKFTIGKNHSAAVRDAFGIDGTVAFAQARTGRSSVLSFAAPVRSDARENGFFASGRARHEADQQNDGTKRAFHGGCIWPLDDRAASDSPFARTSLPPLRNSAAWRPPLAPIL